jgi:TonB family protein
MTCAVMLVLLMVPWPVAGMAMRSPQDNAAGKPIDVSPSEAAAHILTKVEPSYPPIAKVARIQGTVKVEAVITENGIVSNLKVISGHPMLVTSALDALKQWKYRPFVVQGHTVSVSTVVEIPFSLGISGGQYRAEQEAADKYFKESRKCREFLQADEYAKAEASCRTSVELGEKLPPARQNERRSAYQLLGHSLFRQRRFAEALPVYQHELAVAEASLKGYEAELGYARRDVAHALHGAGDLYAADPYYAKALETLERARNHLGSEFLKNEYSRTIKSVLKTYAILLRQTNQPEKAEALERRADAIVVRDDLKNPY